MFEQLASLQPDPILGLMAAYRGDDNPNKIDLGVGVYRDDHGNTPIMAAVLEAQARHDRGEITKSYVGMAGDPAFNSEMVKLMLGPDHAAHAAGRVVCAQTPGGCGGLRVGAELINRAQRGATIWVSDPTWANHVPLLGNAGLTIKTYPYYDATTHGLKRDQMLAALSTDVAAGDLVLLHGCCHNPTGVDLEPADWDAVARLALERGFIPFVDMAYQGLATGLDDDAVGVRKLAASVPEMLIAASCSKNFGLYRERVGVIAAVAADATLAGTVSNQLLNVARGIYSMPPNHGAALAGMILADPELRLGWEQELTGMRDRINGLRAEFADMLRARLGEPRFDFVTSQRGMFSFLGITQAQVARLRDEFSIYMVDSSRINVAGLNAANIEYCCDALVAVL